MWDSLKSLNKSPHDRNCFRLLPRVPPGSILEVLAKCRADLRFWWCLCYSAAICAKRRPYAITQNIDGKFNLQYTTRLARSRGGASEQAASVGIKFMPHVVCLCVCTMYMLIVHETQKMQPMHTKTNLDSAYSTLPRSSSTNVKILHLP